MNDYTSLILSRKIADKKIICNRVILIGKPDLFRFRAYERGQMKNYTSYKWEKEGILGDISTRKKGKKEDNNKEANQLIMLAFPEIKGYGTIFNGYIEVVETNLPDSLKD